MILSKEFREKYQRTWGKELKLDFVQGKEMWHEKDENF